MCNILKLSGLAVCQEGFVKFFSAWGSKKMLGFGLLGGISTQSNTMKSTIEILEKGVKYVQS